jgi:hypothetical protein
MTNFEQRQARTNEIRESIESGAIDTASSTQLSKYTQWLAQPLMAGCFVGQEYAQVCETIRLHMLRVMIEDFEKRGKAMQWLIVALAVAALLASAVQIAVAICTPGWLCT